MLKPFVSTLDLKSLQIPLHATYPSTFPVYHLQLPSRFGSIAVTTPRFCAQHRAPEVALSIHVKSVVLYFYPIYKNTNCGLDPKRLKALGKRCGDKSGLSIEN
jgi:hypothetical protein